MCSVNSVKAWSLQICLGAMYNDLHIHKICILHVIMYYLLYVSKCCEGYIHLIILFPVNMWCWAHKTLILSVRSGKFTKYIMGWLIFGTLPVWYILIMIIRCYHLTSSIANIDVNMKNTTLGSVYISRTATLLTARGSDLRPGIHPYSDWKCVGKWSLHSLYRGDNIALIRFGEVHSISLNGPNIQGPNGRDLVVLKCYDIL